MNVTVVSELFIIALTSAAVWTMTTGRKPLTVIIRRDSASYTGRKAVINEEGNEDPMTT